MKKEISRQIINVVQEAYRRYIESANLFATPVFVFQSKNMAEEFKLFVLKNANEIGYNTYLNIKTITTNEFLFSCFFASDTSDDSKEQKKVRLLDKNTFADFIAYKLLSKQSINLPCYYERMSNHHKDEGWQDVKKFIEAQTIEIKNGEQKINYVNLYDLSSRLAALFFEYMESDVDLEKKHTDSWLQNEFLNNSWQQTLYNDVISFAAKFGYVLPSSLYKQAISKLPNISNDIYYFYYDIGAEYMKPLSQKIIGSLASKAQSTTDKDNNQKRITLCPLQTGDIKHNSDDFVHLITSPSKLREIEGVYGQICNLLFGKSEKAVENLDDILILAPDINEYRNQIYQVFCTSPDNRSPTIAITIEQASRISENRKALDVLFRIAEKHYYTRKDFFELANNNVIAQKFNITDAKIDIFARIIDNQNIFRNRPSFECDWRFGLNNLLFSTLMTPNNPDVTYKIFENANNNFTCFSPFKDTSTIKPFSVLGADDSVIESFSSLVNALEDWLNLWCKDEQDKDQQKKDLFEMLITREQVKKIRDIFCTFLDNSALAFEDDIRGENEIFKSVLAKINELEYLYLQDDSQDGIPYYIFKKSILDSTCDIKIDDICTTQGAIRCSSISLDVPYDCKYLFLVGMNSNNFSIQRNENVLDIRGVACADLSKDGNFDFFEERRKKQQECFETQLKIPEKLYVSFVNRDLKKDEEFYISSELASAIERIYGLSVYEMLDDLSCDKRGKLIELKIEENRPFEQLWSEHEIRLKQIQGIKKEPRQTNCLANFENQVPDMLIAKNRDVKPSDIKAFLNDPFQFQAKEVFGNMEDDNIQKDVFENIVLDSIASSSIKKCLIKNSLADKNFYNAFRKTETCKDLHILLNTASAGADLKDFEKIPDGIFGENSIRKLKQEILETEIKTEGGKCNIIEAIDQFIQPSTQKIDEKIDLLLTLNECNYHIIGLHQIYNSDYQMSRRLNVFSLTSSILDAYISSLILLSELPNSMSDEDFEVYLANVKKKTLDIQSYKSNSAGAKKTICDIIDKMYRQRCFKCIPYDIISDKKEFDKIKNLNDLSEKLTGSFSGSWNYFANKDLFVPERDCGYREESFPKDWKASVDLQKSMILYL